MNNPVEQLQAQIERDAQRIGCALVRCDRGYPSTTFLWIVPNTPLSRKRVEQHGLSDGVGVYLPTDKAGRSRKHSTYYRKLDELAGKLDQHKEALQQRAADLNNVTDRGAYLDTLTQGS